MIPELTKVAAGGILTYVEEKHMTTDTLTLVLSDDQTIRMPAHLAEQAGLPPGEVRVVLGEHSITLVPAETTSEYAKQWPAVATLLREQAASLGLPPEDGRDQSYWDVVKPLLADTERIVGGV